MLSVEQNQCIDHFYKHRKYKVQQEPYTKNSQAKGFGKHLGDVWAKHSQCYNALAHSMDSAAHGCFLEDNEMMTLRCIFEKIIQILAEIETVSCSN